jgi:hypothetical protein
MSTSTTISSGPDQIQLGRFCTGMERTPATPSTLRIARFSDGQALPLIVSPAQFGRFADGQVRRADAAARLRVGSFGDGYDAVAARRSASRRRVRDAAPAHA